ncbi:MAG TPA: CBS domain-containing protein [Candidatus Omnitrophota bacterium]|nr:CBS domain-containing protein [Candidatus Omnitrophota bacterium]
MRDILLKDVMVTKVVTAFIKDSLSKTEEKFRLHGIRHLPVVDDKKRVVGMFTQRDLMRCLAPRKTEDGYIFDKEQLDRFILEYVMAKDPVTLGPEDTLRHVIDIMARDKFGCIPIVRSDGVLLGIVTQIDVLKYIARWFREEDNK